MSQKPPIAFAGPRLEELVFLPSEWSELFCRIAAYFARQGHPIRCGAADGCDQRSAEEALRAGGTVHLVLPWDCFAGDWPRVLETRYPGRISITIYDPKAHARWAELFEEVHPSPRSPGKFSRQCLIRVGGILESVSGVVVLPGDECDLASRYALLLGRTLDIPVWDLRDADVREEWKMRINAWTGAGQND